MQGQTAYSLLIAMCDCDWQNGEICSQCCYPYDDYDDDECSCDCCDTDCDCSTCDPSDDDMYLDDGDYYDDDDGEQE